MYRPYIILNEFRNNFYNKDIIEDVKRIAHNTFEYIYNGTKKIRYCETDIIIFKNNYIILNVDKFFTNITKDRLNRFLYHGYIYQKNHQ